MSERMDYAAFSSRYKDREYVGSGGFAKVYKVFDHAKNHYVALKIADVRPEYKQFTLQREVELVNQLAVHRNIARYDACYRFNTGITGEVDFAVLKFYEYGNLEQFLKSKKLPLNDLHIIIKGILRGTAFLHRNGITHRDLKSQNILMNREDGVWAPKIADFGLAREFGGSHTITNSSIGLSYAYAAPEQIMNQRIRKNVDLWAAGVIIYRIISGELPFISESGGNNQSTQSQLELSRKILNLELPAKLNNLAEPYQSVIRRCLVLDPKERAQTAEELLDILQGGSPQEIISPTASIQPVNPPEDRYTGEATQVLHSVEPPSAPQSAAANVEELSEPPSWTPPAGVESKVPAETTPPQPSSPPPPSYAKLSDNHTQIVHQPTTPTPPSPPRQQQPTTGEPDEMNWRYPLYALLFICLCVIGFFAYRAYESGDFEEKESSGLHDPLPIGEKPPPKEEKPLPAGESPQNQ